jgi:hypothetical protein
MCHSKQSAAREPGGNGINELFWRILSDVSHAKEELYSMDEAKRLRGPLAPVCMMFVVSVGLAQNQTPPNPPPEKTNFEGVVVVSADSPCTVSVDGNGGETLAANQPRSLTVSPGSHVIVGTSTEQPSVTQRKTVEVHRKEQEAVVFELRQDVAAALRRELVGRWEVKGGNTWALSGNTKWVLKATLQMLDGAQWLEGHWSSVSQYTPMAGMIVQMVEVTIYHEATFRLDRDGSKVAGSAETSRTRRTEITLAGQTLLDTGWQDSGAAQFSGQAFGDSANKFIGCNVDFAGHPIATTISKD